MSSSHDVSAHAAWRAAMSPDRELNQIDRLIYGYLVYRANGLRLCWKKVEEIQSDLNIKTRQTVCAVTKKLKARGLIEIRHRRRDSNHYRILDPDGALYGGPNDAGWHFPWRESAANQDVKDSALQEEVASEADSSASPEPDVAKTALLDEPLDVAKTALLQKLDVKKTAHESVHQESKKDTQGSLATLTPRARESATAEVGAKTGGKAKTLIPEDWSPCQHSTELAASLGMDAARVSLEADNMRDWAVFNKIRGVGWNLRFNNWLREAHKRDQRNAPRAPAARPPTHRQQQAQELKAEMERVMRQRGDESEFFGATIDGVAA